MRRSSTISPIASSPGARSKDRMSLTQAWCISSRRPPGGKLGQLAAKLFGEEPAQQVHDDLRAFKQVMETGEVVRSDATTVEGRMRKRPGRPPEGDEIET